MNNYEDRTMNHKRVRMDGEGGGPGVVQGNGLPLNYMGMPREYNGHQISYQPYAGAYNAHYAPADVPFGGYGGGDVGYAARGLSYVPAPPAAHQVYPGPPSQPVTSAFGLQQQQPQQMLHVPYEQQAARGPLPAAPHHAPQHHNKSWPMQPLQHHPEHLMKHQDLKVKQEVKADPEPPGQPVSGMRHPDPQSSHPLDSDPSGQNALNEEPPKIKIKTDLFKENEVAQQRRGVITESGELEKLPMESVIIQNDDLKSIIPSVVPDPSKIGESLHNSDIKPDMSKDPAALEGDKTRISEGGNMTDGANKFQSPNLGSTPMKPIPGTITPGGTPGVEVKKRGRPKGSTNKPKPPEVLAMKAMGGMPRPQVGRPRGGGHSGSYMHGIRPFKRDFSGIRFRRRWSDDGLDSSHIPNEVYFGDVPVSMEVLFNYYDSNAEREKMLAHKQAQGGSGNVTLVYSSSDSSDDDDSDSDSSDTDPNQPAGGLMKRRPGRPRGSKTINRRSDGPRMSGSHSPGDKPAGITEMKRFLKIAGIDFDYQKIIEGASSNKERVNRLMNLLREKGLEGEPDDEKCRALYDGPPPKRRGPKPGSKRTPKSERVEKMPKTPPEIDEGSRRVTRGQTSGKPRQRIVISSDEEDSPLIKLKMVR